MKNLINLAIVIVIAVIIGNLLFAIADYFLL